jgi:4-amino-4-deoxy-L-arabinose transferase-like glycosyltransferase
MSQDVDTASTELIEQPPPPTTEPARQRMWIPSWWRYADISAVVVLLAGFIAIVAALRRAIAQPLWFDEQWRAYFISVSADWWHRLGQATGPMAALWYALERAAVAIGGNTETPLRLTNIGWMLAMTIGMYALTRIWLGPLASLIVAALVMVNGELLNFAVQLKPYNAEAAGVTISLAALFWARRGTRTRWRVLGFAVAAIGVLISMSAIFVIGPVLACFIVEWAWRRREDRVLLIGSVIIALIAGAHLKFWLMRQSTVTKSTYFDPNFAPHSSFSAFWRFTWDQTQSYVPNFVTGAYAHSARQFYPVHITSTWHRMLTVVLTVLIVAGAVYAWRSYEGRVLVISTAAAFVLNLIASMMRLWPYGWIRTSLYVVPLLYLLGALGVRGAVALAAHCRERYLTARAGERAALTFGALASACAVVLAVFAMVASASVSVGIGRRVVPGPTPSGYGRNINSAVATVRQHADDHTAVVVVGSMALLGWQYYMYDRKHMPGRAVPLDRSLFLTQHDSAQITSLLAGDRDLTRVYYYVPMGTTGKSVAADSTRVTAAGFCRASHEVFRDSGLLTGFTRCG